MYLGGGWGRTPLFLTLPRFSCRKDWEEEEDTREEEEEKGESMNRSLLTCSFVHLIFLFLDPLPEIGLAYSITLKPTSLPIK